MREKCSEIKQNAENKGNGPHPPPLTRRSPFPEGKVLGAAAPLRPQARAERNRA